MCRSSMFGFRFHRQPVKSSYLMAKKKTETIGFDHEDSQTIGGSSTSERVKENFALHFVMNGQASVIDKTGDIAFEGNIRREATFCIISFPGKFASGWDALVAALHGESVACVFLTTPETGLGKHKDDGSGKCWCSQIYGERNFKQFGYLVEMKDPDPEKLKQALENAKCTHAIVVPFHATPEERKAYEEEAKKAWEKYGKVASWGCEWFVVWMEQVQGSPGHKGGLSNCKQFCS